ncbi:MAG TPA: phytoene desaturase family protein [Solirubrobacteraceae bacterium]|jgi:phytoene desaturase
MTHVVVVGAGVGGLTAAVRCAEAGHSVAVLEATGAAGGKAGRLERDGFRFDTGPSLVTMPHVFADLLGDRIELLPVEPVTRYSFADGTSVELSADLERSIEALEAWSPGTGAAWRRFMATCAAMWRSSEKHLTGEPPWPPRRPRPGEPPPDPRDLLRVRPWSTLRGLARAHTDDPRLQTVIERFATYAGADPRRAPAALALAGYVEHAFGAWHPRGGIYAIVRALVARAEELGVELRYGTPATAIRRSASGLVVATPSGPVPADWVVWNGDALTLDAILGRRSLRPTASLSGYVLMLGLRGRTPGLAHHTIAFPRSYDAEFDDVFVHGRPVADPTLYVSCAAVTDPSEAPPGDESWFVLVNAPPGLPDAAFEGYEERLIDRLGVRDRIAVRARRTPADLERETGAVGGAIYGTAPHGRLGTLRRPGPRVRGFPNLLRVGGTAHPGGGLPLVALSGQLAARIIGR